MTRIQLNKLVMPHANPADGSVDEIRTTLQHTGTYIPPLVEKLGNDHIYKVLGGTGTAQALRKLHHEHPATWPSDIEAHILDTTPPHTHSE